MKEGRPEKAAAVAAWTLTPERQGDTGGTRLVLEHYGIENIPWLQRAMMNFGWRTMVKRWIPRVAASVSGGVFSPGAFPLEKRCYKVKTISAEMVR